MQHQVREMINKRLIFKEVILDGIGKNRQRNIRVIDQSAEYILNIQKSQRPDLLISKQMRIIIPIDKTIFQTGQESKSRQNNHNRYDQNIFVRIQYRSLQTLLHDLTQYPPGEVY